MSNRQARREQARTTRSTRPTRPAPGSGKGRPTGSGGGGSSVFTSGFMLVFGGFLVLAVIAVILVLVLGGDGGSDSDLVAAMEKHNAELPTELVNGTKIGKDDAPVKITEFEDFQCPFCLQYTADQEGGIINELVKTGKVQLEFRNLPILGAESVSAAIAGQCAADQNKFWQYHNLLFLTQAKADQVGNEKTNVGRFSDGNLKQFAKDLSLDTAKFDECYDSRAPLELILQQQRDANQFGITGTPGFLVNGQPLGTGTPSSLDDWKQIVTNVENAIATATANAGASPTASASAAPTATATKAP